MTYAFIVIGLFVIAFVLGFLFAEWAWRWGRD